MSGRRWWWWGGGESGSSGEPTIPGRLSVSGRHLINATTNAPYFVPGVDAFDFLHLFLDGRMAEIEAFCDWCDECGLEELRAFGQWELSGFYPAHYGDFYYAGVKAAARYLAARPRPLRLKVVALTSGNEIPQSQWVDIPRLDDTLKDEANVRFSLVNEYPQNGVDPWLFTKPAHLLSSRGSSVGDELPPFPMWQYAEFHAPRDSKWFNGVLCRSWVRSCKAASELRLGDNADHAAYACVDFDEPIAWGPKQEDGRTDNDPFSAWQYGAGCRFFGACSVTFHYRPSKPSALDVPDAVTTACAKALMQGFHLPIGECANGVIRHSSGLHFQSEDRFIDNGPVVPAGTMDSYEAQVGSRIEGLALQPGQDWRLQTGNAIKAAYSFTDEAPSVFVLRA